MELKIKYLGKKTVEFICLGYDGKLIEDIANNDGYIDVDLIENLRQVANELEEHNSKLKNAIKNE